MNSAVSPAATVLLDNASDLSGEYIVGRTNDLDVLDVSRLHHVELDQYGTALQALSNGFLRVVNGAKRLPGTTDSGPVTLCSGRARRHREVDRKRDSHVLSRSVAVHTGCQL